MDHDSNRTKICLLCLKYQCSYSKRTKTVKYREVLKSKELIIKIHFIANYQFVDTAWPSIVCKTCDAALGEAKRGKFLRKIQKYEFVPPINRTRPRQSCCDCFFCAIVNKEKNKSPTLFRKKAKKLQKKGAHLCPRCLTEINRGKRHICNKTTLVKRAKKILQENEADGPVMAQLVKENDSNVMNLRNLKGKPRVLYLEKPKNVEPITVDDFNDLQKNYVGSKKKTENLLTMLRRKGVPIESKILPTVQKRLTNSNNSSVPQKSSLKLAMKQIEPKKSGQ